MEELEKSTDFLFYNSENGTTSVQVVVGNDTVWTTQKGMSDIFDVTTQNISIHLSNIFETNELKEDSVCKEILHTAADGKKYKTKFYNLDVIIGVGYRVNSYNATKFRIWATNILREYLVKGFVLDDERLKQGNNIFNKDHFKELLERIRDIRSSEKMFYEQVKDLFTTSEDYDKNSPKAIVFFQTIQNKLEYAIAEKTSAEIIKTRANAKLPNMNLQTWKNVKKGGNIQKSDVTVAKNYLNENELSSLKLLVTMFLDYGELQAKRSRIMKMNDWVDKIDSFLVFNNYRVLDNAGSIRKDVADKFAEGEYAKYKIIQDRDKSQEFKKVVDVIKATGKLPSEQENIKSHIKGLTNIPPPKK